MIYQPVQCVLLLTFVMLVVVDLAHVVINLPTFGGGDVRGGVFSLPHEFVEERVHLAQHVLPI